MRNKIQSNNITERCIVLVDLEAYSNTYMKLKAEAKIKGRSFPDFQDFINTSKCLRGDFKFD
jgi:hypothetical protein